MSDDQLLHDLPDEDLLTILADAAASRERQSCALDILSGRYWDVAYRIGFAWRRDRHAAEDIAQAMTSRIPRIARTYEPGSTPGGFRSYFRRCVQNHIRDLMRSLEQRRVRTSTDPRLLEENLPADRSPAEDLTAQDDADTLLKFNWPAQKDSLRLMYVEDRSAEEIAAHLGMTPKEVYVHLDSGRKRLIDVLLDRVLNLRDPLPEHLRLKVLRRLRPQAVPRRPRTAPPLAARGPATRPQWLNPAPEGILLDRLLGCLDWEQEPNGRWRGVLRFWSRSHHPEGNDDVLLRPFDRAAIMMQWTASGQGQSGLIETVLARHPAYLISPCFRLAVDPDSLTGVKLMVRGWLE
jgi:RNA polymerase sigma factor (sigma-70 family)